MSDCKHDEWHVYKLNDCDWWMARSMDEAKTNAAEYYGCEQTDSEMFQDDAHQLTEEELGRFRYFPDAITFREELNRRIAAGPKVEMFATTEF